MDDSFRRFIEATPEAKAFDLFRRGERVPFSLMLRLLPNALLWEPLHFFLRVVPGSVGLALRGAYWKLRLKHLGHRTILDNNVQFDGPENISIGDYVWIDRNTRLSARVGSITIGKRVHVSPNSLISAGSDVVIGDYVGISSGVMIYGHSESPRDGKRMSGPMIPEEVKGMVTKPVTIEKDAFLGAYAVILPGVTVGEGAVVAACSLVTRDVQPWTIVMGVPARLVGRREPVNVPDC